MYTKTMYTKTEPLQSALQALKQDRDRIDQAIRELEAIIAGLSGGAASEPRAEVEAVVDPGQDTIAARAIRFLTNHGPARAKQVSRAIKAKEATTVAELYRLAKIGRLKRVDTGLFAANGRGAK
jgi:hypothetical protein